MTIASIDRNKKVSNSLFWVIQILFGLIFVQGLVIYKNIILDPFESINFYAFYALISIYITALLSWIDFSSTIDLNPYGRYSFEVIRFFTDVTIVSFYAATLFSVQKIIDNQDISYFLRFYVFIYLLYFISGIFRIIEYGKNASRWKLILFFTALYLLQYYLFSFVIKKGLSFKSILIIFTSSSLFLTVAYRLTRHYIIKKSKLMKKQSLRIAVDIDGVIANQIEHILKLIKDRYNLVLKYNDINQWDMPIDNTNIKDLIENEQLHSEEYILDMPVHNKAKSVLDRLYSTYRIAIITARNAETDNITKLWLESNKIQYDEFINIKGKMKSNFDFDIIIDDYPKNIENVVINSKRYGLLFKQPWNESDISLSAFKDKNLFVVNNWDEVYDKITKSITKLWVK